MTGRTSTVTLVTSIAISLIFTIIIIWNLDNIVKKHREASFNELMSFYTHQQKTRIRNEIERLTSRIRNLRSTEIENAKAELKERIDAFEEFTRKSIRQNPSLTAENIAHSLSGSLSKNSTLGFFFIITNTGEILHNGSNFSSEGKNISVLKGTAPDQYNFFSGLLSGKVKSEYAFFATGADEQFGKLAYASYFSELGIVIGSGIYIDDIDRKLQQTILASIKDERFGVNNSDYIWVIDKNYNSIFHIDEGIQGKNHYNLQDINGKYIFKDIVDIALTSGSGFYQYHWYLPGGDTPSEKISYLQYIPEWKWVVGTGFYYEKFHEMLKHEEQISNRILSESIKQNTVIILSLFTLILAVAFIIYKRIRKIEDGQEDFISDLKQYKSVLDSSSIVSVTDTEGTITHVNDRFCSITGYPEKDIIGNRHSIISHPDNPKSIYRELWTTITAGSIWKGIIKNMKSDGSYFYQKTTVVPFRNKNGETIRYISISHDVTEVFENKSKLQKQLNVDMVTGLGSRSSLLGILSSSRQSDIAVLDISDFHRINETYGMSAGDKLLRAFAERLNENEHIHKYDLYRLHSDVFAVFSYNSSMAEFSADVEKAVNSITSGFFTVDGKEVLLRTTIGFAEGSSDLLTRADIALKYAKNNNLDKSFYNAEQQISVRLYETDSKIIKMLTEAINNDRVVPFFQKIKGISDTADKYECLIRILDKDGGIISPAEFLDISKHTRLYPALTKMMAKKAIDTFEGTDTEFSINVSTEDLLNKETMDFIYEYALEKKIIRKLILEVVETESITSSAAVTEVLYRFKLAGARIAIDDFGTGYSNFDYLLKIKADFIKIDGSIIKLISKDERARDIVRSIVSYSKKLNMKTVAEFISEKELADAAAELGIDYLQGYYIGKPEKSIYADNVRHISSAKSG